MYRALVAYQEERISVEEAARLFGVNPHTLRRRMRDQGWRVRSCHETGKKRQGSTRDIPDSAVAESEAGTPTWVLAQRYRVTVRVMQRWLRTRGIDQSERFTERHAQQMSDKARPMVEQIVALRQRGMTHGQIGIRLGVSPGYSSAVFSRWTRKRYRWQRDDIQTTRGEDDQ